MMKFLFFDIECANCFDDEGKICEYGYVLTDENFNILKQDDIVMSPGKGSGCRFHLRGRSNQKDLELAYEESYYYEQPEFPYFYERIRKLMEDEDTICFAWDHENDIRFIQKRCLRYKKNPIKFVCYDIQKFAMNYYGVANFLSLKPTCYNLVGSKFLVSIQEHLSRDDAKMTMMIFDALCILNKSTPVELLNKNNAHKIDSIEYLERIKEKEIQDKIRKERLNFIKDIETNDLRYLDNEAFLGKRYRITSPAKIELEKLKELSTKIHDIGGVLSGVIEKTDFFVVKDDELVEKFKEIFKERTSLTVIKFEDIK